MDPVSHPGSHLLSVLLCARLVACLNLVDVGSGTLGSSQIQAKSDPLETRAQATVEANLTAKLPLGTFII